MILWEDTAFSLLYIISNKAFSILTDELIVRCGSSLDWQMAQCCCSNIQGMKGGTEHKHGCNFNLTYLFASIFTKRLRILTSLCQISNAYYSITAYWRSKCSKRFLMLLHQHKCVYGHIYITTIFGEILWAVFSLWVHRYYPGDNTRSLHGVLTKTDILGLRWESGCIYVIKLAPLLLSKVNKMAEFKKHSYFLSDTFGGVKLSKISHDYPKQHIRMNDHIAMLGTSSS